ncbi:hypothetical protein ES703_03446 [subsurface metagenome]
MTKSKIFLYFCLSFVFGIAISSFFTVSQLLMLGFLILGILLISVFWRYKILVVIGFCLLFLVLGVWRHQSALEKPNIIEGETSLTGIVCQEPDVRMDNVKLTVKIEKLGKVLVTTSRYPQYQYGDQLKITGNLQIPHVFEDFNYQDYLAKDGIYSVMYYPEIEYIRGSTSKIYGRILQFKDKLRKSIYQNLSPPQSSILGAILLGDKRRLSEELKEKLNIAGVRHITAISGMHIMILSGVLMYLAMALGLWRGQAFYFALIILILFIIMVGLPASAVRAGIMVFFYLLAEKVGRPKSGSRAIVFAATCMLIANPLLLKLDVGFQLSFLAVMGITYLMPLLQKFLKFRLLAMTLSAQVFTLPILIYNFGYVSFAAPITNILIVPLLPFIMGLGFVFALGGIIWSGLGWVLSWPVWLLSTYIIKIVEFFS